MPATSTAARVSGIARAVEFVRGKIDNLEDALTLQKPPLKRADLSPIRFAVSASSPE